MKWFEKPEVLDYIVDCYQGTDGRKRQFIWEDTEGNVVIGNARAFTDHCAEKFCLEKTPTAWSGVHCALRMLGEVVNTYTPRSHKRGKRFRNQQPETRILKRGRNEKDRV